jgi:hypothetical protein
LTPAQKGENHKIDAAFKGIMGENSWIIKDSK